MKIFLNILHYALVLAISAVALLVLASLTPIAHFKVKIVKSGSMEPAIMTGGIVVDRPESAYVVGDIITFGPDTKTQIPTTHRIIAVEGEGASAIYTTKGDANDAPDQANTRLSDIHGKVLFTVPYLGFVLDFARKPIGFALLVGLPALFVILDEITKMVREVMLMRKKKAHAIQPQQGQPRRRID